MLPDTYQIHIHELSIFAYHGVFPEEKALGQKFILNIDIWSQLSSNILDDHIKNAISYHDVAVLTEQIFTSQKFDLLETAALHILDGLKKFSLIKKAQISIKKPSPPIPMEMAFVGITMIRED